MPVMFTNPLQRGVLWKRGDVLAQHNEYAEATSELIVPERVADEKDTHFIPRVRRVTYTWQVPVVAGGPSVRLVPEDPDRIRLQLTVSAGVVYMCSLSGGPQTDYGYPIISGNPPLELVGQNQFWGVIPAGGQNATVYVLVERELPHE